MVYFTWALRSLFVVVYPAHCFIYIYKLQFLMFENKLSEHLDILSSFDVNLYVLTQVTESLNKLMEIKLRLIMGAWKKI